MHRLWALVFVWQKCRNTGVCYLWWSWLTSGWRLERGTAVSLVVGGGKGGRVADVVVIGCGMQL